MTPLVRQLNIDNIEPYQVVSRREINLLLHGIQNDRQLLKMIYNGHGESIVTTILEIDQANNCIVIDCAQDEQQNQKIAAQPNFSFDTTLQKVRIMFFANQLERCLHEGKPAFRFTFPKMLIRLQRREIYRVRVPRTPVIVPHQIDETTVVEITAFLQDLSAGGIGMLDETLTLDNTVGHHYENCHITLADKNIITVTLQVRNSQDISLANGKTVRRLGCQFVDLPNTTLASLQRLITKIEREQNAKAVGNT